MIRGKVLISMGEASVPKKAHIYEKKAGETRHREALNSYIRNNYY